MIGAQALIESLKKENVTHIFGHAGATICPIVDCLASSGIDFTLVRFEQGAGHMASGYARVSGKTGVCLVASGPGATNLITGIATAYMDSIPVVAITGQVLSNMLGRDVFQEIDMTSTVAPYIKHSYLVKDANDIPRIIKEAFYIASTGRPGPVLIDMPIDIQCQEMVFSYPETVNIRGYQMNGNENNQQIQKVKEAIAEAKRPLICAGGGILSGGARKELEELAVSAGIPVVTTMMGLSVLPTEHSMNIGMIGSQGKKAANDALYRSDLLIIAGARVADRAMPKPSEATEQTRIIHLEVDPAEIGKNVTVEIPVIGDIKAVLRQILEQKPKADASEWVGDLQERRDKDQIKNTLTHDGYVTPRFVLQELGEKMDDDAYVCVDVGQNQIWAARHLPIKNGRFLTTGGFGTMGYALPAAIGVKKADPQRQTVVVTGDGGFQMSMNELATMCATGADIKIVLIQNNTLGLVSEVQLARYTGPYGVDISCAPNFEMLASAYGINCRTLSDDNEICGAVDQILASEGPFLLICNVSPDALTSD